MDDIRVVESEHLDQFVGLITPFDVFQAHQKPLDEERHDERVLSIQRVTRLWSPDPSRLSPGE